MIGLEKLTPRSLVVALRNAKKELAWHGRESWCGKEAKKEIAALEAEFKRRGLELPAPQSFRKGSGGAITL